MDRVARVRPDLPAVDREFDYLVPDAMARDVHVGTIVRVPLHGRRVRGWVGALGVEPETAAELRPILAVSSDGPPPEVMELCAWTAWRYAGPVVHVLRAASPPNAARVEPPPARPPGAAAAPSRAHLEWPPAADRKALVADLVARAGSSIVVTPAPGRSGPLARALAAGGRRVVAYGGTDAERTAAWRAATRGNCVIIGGRIAVFAPVPDLAALVVVRAPSGVVAARAAERLLRSGAFGLVVLDFGSANVDVPMAHQGRLVSLAQAHDAAIVCLTDKTADSASLGSLVSLRAEALRARGPGGDGFQITVRALKDKRRGPGWTRSNKARGPAGL